MPKMSLGAFENNKTQLIISDAYAWAKSYRRGGGAANTDDNNNKKEKKYNVAIMDILDPEDTVSVDGSAAARLYDSSFLNILQIAFYQNEVYLSCKLVQLVQLIFTIQKNITSLKKYY